MNKIKFIFLISSIITALLFSTANGQDSNDFEAELRRLETQDETLLNKVENISKQNDDFITDSVSVGNAATLREYSNEEVHLEEIVAPKVKERRVRSR